MISSMEGGGGIMAALDGASSSRRDDNSFEPKHLVFLSHSGAQKSFVKQLCMDIEEHDRSPFFDQCRDCLPIGCDFPSSIFKAIEQCQVAVVVLSEEFFSKTKWPMLELAALVKRKAHDSSLTIMPVFLGMTHAQCRDKGNHDRWLILWRSWAEQDNRIIVEDWEVVFKVFGPTNGISLTRLHEVNCRQEIVDAICREVPPNTRWDDSHVQGRSRMYEEIQGKIKDLSLSKCYGVRVLGVYGVGGIGKSTTCMVLCNNYFKEFQGRVCHVEFGSGDELQMLLEILKRLTNTKHEVIGNLNKDECKYRMKRTIKKKRVLLAIDNVHESYQIVNQAKDILRSGFEEGSLVIVTARSLEELQNLGIHESECMEMPELLENEAMSLFLYHATPGLHLRNVEFDMEQLIRQCVQQCRFGKGKGFSYHYHPLALKVLGGQLGNNLRQWLGKLKGIDPFNQYQENDDMHPIFSILGRSFKSLNEEDQFLFLDAAIFNLAPNYWIPINLFTWLSMVHGRSIDVIKTRLEGLKRKSVLEDLGDGSAAIGMHDLWREFAVKKAKGREFGSEPWFYREVYILNDPRREEYCLSGGGWKNLQRVCFVGDRYPIGDGYLPSGKYIVKELDLKCCLNLRVLKLVGVDLEIQVLDVSSLQHLKSLEVVLVSSSVQIFGLGCLTNLVFLRLGSKQRDLPYEEIEGLTSLNALILSCSTERVEKLPDLSRLTLLQDAIFYGFEKADTISGLSSRMTNLKHLRLSCCEMLLSCNGVGELLALEELHLSRCYALEKLPNLGKLTNLLNLDIFCCELLEAVPGLSDLVSLQSFVATGCARLAELPDMHKLVNLQELRLGRCPLIQTIPGSSDLIALKTLEAAFRVFQGISDLRKMTKLEDLQLEEWSAQGCLPCMSYLVNLKWLWIEYSAGVDEFADLLNLGCNLEHLVIESCSFKDVQFRSNTPRLTYLSIYDCHQLQRLRGLDKLTGLEKLTIRDCESLRDWKSGSGLRLFGADLNTSATFLHLHTLDLYKVAFTELPDLSSFPQLRDLSLKECGELTSLTSSAPSTALETLKLKRCRNLRTLPDLSQLVSLRCFTLKDCGVQLTQNGIEKMNALCPGLGLHLDDRPVLELERDAKRLRS